MDWKQKLPLWLQALLRKQDLDSDMAQEMRSHIEMQTRENIEAGMAPDKARCKALRQFGWVESTKETLRNCSATVRRGRLTVRGDGVAG